MIAVARVTPHNLTDVAKEMRQLELMIETLLSYHHRREHVPPPPPPPPPSSSSSEIAPSTTSSLVTDTRLISTTADDVIRMYEELLVAPTLQDFFIGVTNMTLPLAKMQVPLEAIDNLVGLRVWVWVSWGRRILSIISIFCASSHFSLSLFYSLSLSLSLSTCTTKQPSGVSLNTVNIQKGSVFLIVSKMIVMRLSIILN